MTAKRGDRLTSAAEKGLDLVVRTNSVVETIGLRGQGTRDRQFHLVQIMTVFVLQQSTGRPDRLRRSFARRRTSRGAF